MFKNIFFEWTTIKKHRLLNIAFKYSGGEGEKITSVNIFQSKIKIRNMLINKIRKKIVKVYIFPAR